ncbi:MAG: hypothetical protein ILP09_09235, partial [Oscillospiraceae bacterium]|nr:hypothetical protein [Oscillospiraceae bacterium]
MDIRASYALALIEFEEKKALSPFVSYFSRNAAEERIKAIMKTRKYSMTAIAAAVILTAAITVGFATAPAFKDRGVGIMQTQASSNGDETAKRNDTERVRSSAIQEQKTEEKADGVNPENGAPDAYLKKAADAIAEKRIFGSRVIDDPTGFAEREFGKTIFYDDPDRSKRIETDVSEHG